MALNGQVLRTQGKFEVGGLKTIARVNKVTELWNEIQNIGNQLTQASVSREVLYRKKLDLMD